VTYDNSIFVTVGDNGTILTSSNGTTWTSRISGTTKGLRGITYANGTFVAVGKSSTILTSSNGTTWTLVMDADSGKLWTNVTSPTTEDLNDVSFGKNTLVAVGGGYKYEGGVWFRLGGIIIRSTDNGLSWDNVTSPNKQELNGVTFGNNTFVSVGSSSYSKAEEIIVRSTDNGKSWCSTNVNKVPGYYEWEYDGTKGGSLDPNPTMNAVSYGNNIFVAVGVQWEWNGEVSSRKGTIWRSADNGHNWHKVTSPIEIHFNDVTFGNNTFVAVGDNGTIVRSTDNGATWNIAYRRADPSLQYDSFIGVTFGNNTFVVSSWWKDVTSTDNGATWDNATYTTWNSFYGMAFGDNTFVGVGCCGRIDISTDNGTTFDRVTSQTSNTLRGVTFY